MGTKDEGIKKKQSRQNLSTILTALQGKTVQQMTPKEQENLITALAIYADFMDANGVVKPLS